jgi:hypothetical protein
MVFTFISGVNKDIVQINNYEMIQEPYKRSINICLKCGWCVSQPKRHYKIFKMAIAGPESRLPLVSFTNSYPIIYILEIQLCEDLGFSEPVKGLINKRKRMPILDCDLIKSTIIDTKAQPSILLGDKKDRRPCWAFTRPYPTFTKRILQIQTQCFQLGLRQII